MYEKVEHLYIRNVELFRTTTELRNIMVNNLGNVPKYFHDEFKKWKTEMIDAMEKLLLEGIERGEVVDMNPRVAALIVLNGLQVSISYLVDQDEHSEGWN